MSLNNETISETSHHSGLSSSSGGKRNFSDEANLPSPNDSTPSDPTANHGNGQGKKRRINTSANPRGVANLTPDQLAKKRANDREAQRAIRERTKNQIGNLERKIRELTNQQPYQELQRALRQKEQVEAENADIKKRLHSVLGLIRPVLGHKG
jgi:hypothetical protein